MVRSTMRRTAALAGTATLAVLAAAGPALATDAPVPAPHTQSAVAASGPAAPAPDQQTQQGAAQDPAPPVGTKEYVIWCHHHEGVVSELLETVGDLLDDLL